MATLDDAMLALLAEQDENTCRESLKPAEMVEIGRKLEEFLKPKAQERQATTGTAPGKPKNAGGNLPPASADAGKTRDKVAKALGTSGRTYEKAKAVAKAAESDPRQARAEGERVGLW